MAKCDLCGQDAGMLRKRHKECDARHSEGIAAIAALARDAALAKMPVETLPDKARQIADSSFISQGSLPSIYATGFESAVQSVLEDGVLSEDEENSLDAFMKALSLGQDELDGSGAYTTMVKATIIREVLEGKLPERISVSGGLPFNFQKAEKLIWLFQGVDYAEQRTTTRYQGSYQGVSLKVAKGVYYRTGGFRGSPIPVTTTVAVETGALAITQKHIYFAGPSKSFRIPYSKMVTITPFSDGIGIQWDATSAKPQLFTTGDGWFTYNLVSNLAKAAAA